MDSIYYTSSPLLFIPILIIAAAISYLLYNKDKDIEKRWSRLLLAAFRFVALCLIGILLLNPLIKRTQNKSIDQRSILLIDESESVGNWIEKENKSDFLDHLISEFKSEYKDPLVLGFGNQISSIGDTLDFVGQRTNISNALNSIQSNYDPASIGQVIVVSDGLYNTGQNPLNQIDRRPFAVSTVALGDTTAIVDIQVKRVLYNEICFVGDELIVEADIAIKNANASNQKLYLDVYQNGQWKTIDQKQFSIFDNDQLSEKLSLPIEKEGLLRARVRTNALSNEKNRRNNSVQFYVDAIRSKQIIQIVSKAPHPDMAAIKRSLVKKQNNEVTVDLLSDQFVINKNTDVFILHNLPAAKMSQQEGQKLEAILATKKPVLYINSTGTDWKAFNDLQSLVKASVKGKQETNAALTFSPAFSLFELEKDWTESWKRFPPLQVPFGNFSNAAQAQALAYQKISGIETSTPLVVIGLDRQIRTAVILGNGLYRWPYYEYADHGNQDGFDAYCAKLIQYLSVRQDKRQLRAKLNKRIYQEGEMIYVQAELYNDSYEKITSSDLNISVTNQDDDEFFYALSKIGDHYEARIGPFQAGDYYYTISSNQNSLGKQSGFFAVEELDLENRQTVADFALLEKLASLSGGDHFNYSENPKDILNRLNQNQHNKPQLVQELSVFKWIDSKWLLGIIALLVLFEWFLRRLFGSY